MVELEQTTVAGRKCAIPAVRLTDVADMANNDFSTVAWFAAETLS